MKAAVISIYIEKGTDWQKTFRFFSDKAQSVPIDFTGCAGRCQIRDLEGKLVATPVVTFPDAGMLVLALTNEQTSAIDTDGLTYDATGACTYDVEVVLELHSFQVYESLDEAVHDYAAKFFRKYDNGTSIYDMDASTPFTFIDSVASRYATDPKYAWKVKSLIYEYDLRQYDP